MFVLLVLLVASLSFGGYQGYDESSTYEWAPKRVYFRVSTEHNETIAVAKYSSQCPHCVLPLFSHPACNFVNQHTTQPWSYGASAGSFASPCAANWYLPAVLDDMKQLMYSNVFYCIYIPGKSTYAKLTLEVERAIIIDLICFFRSLEKVLLEGLSTQHSFFFLPALHSICPNLDALTCVGAATQLLWLDKTPKTSGWWPEYQFFSQAYTFAQSNLHFGNSPKPQEKEPQCIHFVVADRFHTACAFENGTLVLCQINTADLSYKNQPATCTLGGKLARSRRALQHNPGSRMCHECK